MSPHVVADTVPVGIWVLLIVLATAGMAWERWATRIEEREHDEAFIDSKVRVTKRSRESSR